VGLIRLQKREFCCSLEAVPSERANPIHVHLPPTCGTLGGPDQKVMPQSISIMGMFSACDSTHPQLSVAVSGTGMPIAVTTSAWKSCMACMAAQHTTARHGTARYSTARHGTLSQQHPFRALQLHSSRPTRQSSLYIIYKKYDGHCHNISMEVLHGLHGTSARHNTAQHSMANHRDSAEALQS
jgi:hypothetical protein